MSEQMPQYGTGPTRPLRQPEYFFIRTPEKIFRLRVPWLCVQAVIEIIESPQGHRTHQISWGYMPGPEVARMISTGAAAHILEWGNIEGWIE